MTTNIEIMPSFLAVILAQLTKLWPKYKIFFIGLSLIYIQMLPDVCMSCPSLTMDLNLIFGTLVWYFSNVENLKTMFGVLRAWAESRLQFWLSLDFI